MSLAGGAGSLCDYDGGEGQIMLYPNPKGDPFEGMIKNYGHENLPRTPATEFGKDAYALGLTVSAAEGKPAESVRPTLLAFGKAVLAKLD